MLRRGSSSKKESAKQDVTDKKAAKLKAAEEKAVAKKAAKEKAAADKAAKKEAKAKTKGQEKPAKKEKSAKKMVAGTPRGVLVRRPKASIYTVLLGITAGAITLGCLMLVLEIWTYGAPWTRPWNIPINFK